MVVNDSKTTSGPSHRGYVMPPLKLVNEELVTSSGVGSSPNGSSPNIRVSNLTASWTNVGI